MVGPRVLQGESLEAFNEGIGYILNRWPALRSAVDYQQGGKNSHIKAEKLIDDVCSWFTQSNESLHIEDLKTLIYEGMVAAFDLKICDESDGDIAVELMVIHEDCLNGDFRNIEHLRKASRFDDFSVHIVDYGPEDTVDYESTDEDDSSANMDEFSNSDSESTPDSGNNSGKRGSARSCR